MEALDTIKLLIDEMNELGKKHDYLFFDLAAEVVEKLFVNYLNVKARSFGEFLEKRTVIDFLYNIDLPVSDIDIVNNYAKKVRHSVEFMVAYTVAYNAVVDVVNLFFRKLEIHKEEKYFGRLNKLSNEYNSERRMHYKEKVTTLRTYQMYNYIKDYDKTRSLYYLCVFYERLLKVFLYKSKYSSEVKKETLSDIIKDKRYIRYLRELFDEFHVPDELFIDLKNLNKVRRTVRHTFDKPDISNLNIAILDNFARVFGGYLLDDFIKDFNTNIHKSSKLSKVIDFYSVDFLYWDFAIKEKFIDRLNKFIDEDLVIDALVNKFGNDEYLLYRVCDKLNRKVEAYV